MMIQKDETREYVAAIAAELATMSRQAGLPFLAYLLGLVRAEATETAGHARRKQTVQSTLASDEATRREAAPPTH